MSYDKIIERLTETQDDEFEELDPELTTSMTSDVINIKTMIQDKVMKKMRLIQEMSK